MNYFTSRTPYSSISQSLSCWVKYHHSQNIKGTGSKNHNYSHQSPILLHLIEYHNWWWKIKFESSVSDLQLWTKCPSPFISSTCKLRTNIGAQKNSSREETKYFVRSANWVLGQKRELFIRPSLLLGLPEQSSFPWPCSALCYRGTEFCHPCSLKRHICFSVNTAEWFRGLKGRQWLLTDAMWRQQDPTGSNDLISLNVFQGKLSDFMLKRWWQTMSRVTRDLYTQIYKDNCVYLFFVSTVIFIFIFRQFLVILTPFHSLSASTIIL